MNQLFKLGSSASQILLDKNSITKKSLLKTKKEFDSILLGLQVLEHELPGTVHLPNDINIKEELSNGREYCWLNYDQTLLSPWIQPDWISSQQLFDVASLVLKQQEVLLKNSLTFVDARPENYYLYKETKLVDLGSIKPLNKQNYLSFQTDFANCFLTPLRLERCLNIPIGQFYKGGLQNYNINILGLTSIIKNQRLLLFSARNWFREFVSLRISNSNTEFIEYVLSKQDCDESSQIDCRPFLKKNKSLCKLLDSCAPAKNDLSTWSEYNDFHQTNYVERKVNSIASFISNLSSSEGVVDLGSNVTSSKIPGISAFIDRDTQICNILRNNLGSDKVVLCANIAEELLHVNDFSENYCLNLNGNCKSAIVTSLLHHIIIDAGLSANCFYRSLSLLYNNIFFEFISDEDPMIKLLQAKKGEFISWKWDDHLKIISQFFDVSQSTELSSTRFAVSLVKKNL